MLPHSAQTTTAKAPVRYAGSRCLSPLSSSTRKLSHSPPTSYPQPGVQHTHMDVSPARCQNNPAPPRFGTPCIEATLPQVFARTEARRRTMPRTEEGSLAFWIEVPLQRCRSRGPTEQNGGRTIWRWPLKSSKKDHRKQEKECTWRVEEPKFLHESTRLRDTV